MNIQNYNAEKRNEKGGEAWLRLEDQAKFIAAIPKIDASSYGRLIFETVRSPA